MVNIRAHEIRQMLLKIFIKTHLHRKYVSTSNMKVDVVHWSIERNKLATTHFFDSLKNLFSRITHCLKRFPFPLRVIFFSD